jgi:hypothetical protein
MDPYAATNRDRSEWATVALEAFAKATRMEPLEVNFYECICDLVANLGHLAEEHGRSVGYTALDVYRNGIGKFSAESRDPSGDPYMNDEVEIIVSPGPTECDV